jgi:GH15 family glucan-1,4-alpha-glucosidase
VPHVLREYALLADGERGVLVGPRGDFSWLCFPRWESPALFSSILGGPASYEIAPLEPFVWGGYYEERSLIWRSRWVTQSGAIVESREALALPSAPGRAIVLRRILAHSGTAHMRVSLNLRGDYGRAPLRRLTRDDDGSWSGETAGVHVRWLGSGAAAAVVDGHGGKALTFDLDLAEGAHHDLVLVLAGNEEDLEAPRADAVWSATGQAWRERVPELRFPVGERDARHAIAVLSGLTSNGGGMVAAASMSLPERARGGRNFDYRYVWIRDQCFAGEAAARAGCTALLDDAVRFVHAALLEHGAWLRPAYTTSGERVPDEHDTGLPGYPGGGAVAGNWVNEQFQLDLFGESLLLFAEAASADRLDADGCRAAEVAAAAIAERWHEPDSGIWELGPDQWTHSRLICAAGLRAISAHRHAGANAPRWLALAEEITADTSRRSLHPSGRWQRSPSDDRVDAALLLPALRGAVAADDPRTLATLTAVVDELTTDGYAYRYRPDARPLGEAEGAFIFCGFVLALAWAQQGDEAAAARWFERNRSASGSPGLLSEEFDVTQRQLRGNLPQAFAHALLLESALEQRPSR